MCCMDFTHYAMRFSSVFPGSNLFHFCLFLGMSFHSLRIEGPLPVAKFMSFFSLLRHIFTDNLDGKGELSKVRVIICYICYV